MKRILLGIAISLMSIVPASASHIYWTTGFGQSVERANLDGTGRQTIVPYSNVTGTITVDPFGGKVYWSGVQGRGIYRADLDGSHAQFLISPGRDPSDIEIDGNAGKLYWAESSWPGNGRIMRADLDGTHIETVLTVASGYPDGIALDAAHGYLYWTNTWDGGIFRSTFSGTDTMKILETGVSPIDVELDTVNGILYWTENGQYNRRIRRAHVDGTNVQDIITTDVWNPLGIALDVAAGKMYWGDLGLLKIKRSNLDGTNAENLLTNLNDPHFVALDVPVPPEPSTLMLLGLAWMLAINRRR